MRIGLDTTVLVYAEGVNGSAMQTSALKTLGELRQNNSFIVPVQALGELYAVLLRTGYKTADARRTILDWRAVAAVADTTDSVMPAAVDLAQKHFSIWDAVMVCAAAEAGCHLLLSEDMHDGFVWNGVTIANPFAKTLHPLLRSALGLKP